MDTDEFIQSLINDDTEQLNKLYIFNDLEDIINFNIVYDRVKDINNPLVHSILGYMYHYAQGVEIDYEKSLHYFQLGLKEGNRWAQYYLGWVYRMGHGVENDDEKALNYLKLSAKQGHGWSLNNLGWMYDNGFGVEKNYEKAIRYYLLSSKQGNKRANNNLVNLLNSRDGYQNYLLKVITEDSGLKKENKQLRKKIVELEDEIAELKYRPDGVGYLEAKEHFTALKKN